MSSISDHPAAIMQVARPRQPQRPVLTRSFLSLFLPPFSIHHTGKEQRLGRQSRIFATMPSTLCTRVWHVFLFPQGKGGLIHKPLLKNRQKSEPPFSPQSRNLSARSVLPRLAHHTLRSEIIPRKTTCGRFGELPFYFWLAGSLQFTGPNYHPSYTSLHCRSTSRLQYSF